MSNTKISDLPPEALAEILKYLDWRTRFNCELVSRKFYDVCTQMCSTMNYPWMGLGLPKRLTVVMSMNCFNRKPRLDVEDNVVKINLRPEETEPIGYFALLNKVLSKWAPQIGLLCIQTVELDSKTLQLLCENHSDIGQVKMYGCKCLNVPLTTLARTKTIFDGKLVLVKKDRER